MARQNSAQRAGQNGYVGNSVAADRESRAYYPLPTEGPESLWPAEPKPVKKVRKSKFKLPVLLGMAALLLFMVHGPVWRLPTAAERGLEAREALLEDLDAVSAARHHLWNFDREERQVKQDSVDFEKVSPDFVAAMMKCGIPGHDVHFVQPSSQIVISHVDLGAPLAPTFAHARDILNKARKEDSLKVLIFRDHMQVVGLRGKILEDEKLK